ncbi:MAG: hypothetical protein V7K46_12050 [Nostoc sp.]
MKKKDCLTVLQKTATPDEKIRYKNKAIAILLLTSPLIRPDFFEVKADKSIMEHDVKS